MQGQERKSQFRRNLSWPVVTAIVLVSAPTIFLNDRLHGWGYPTGFAEIIALCLIFACRHLWRHSWFWIRAIPLLLLQAPLVLFARPYMYEYNFAFNLVFWSADMMICIMAVMFGHSASTEDR